MRISPRKKKENREKSQDEKVFGFWRLPAFVITLGSTKEGNLSRGYRLLKPKATMFGRPEANRDDQTPPYPNTRGGQRRGQIEHGDKSQWWSAKINDWQGKSLLYPSWNYVHWILFYGWHPERSSDPVFVSRRTNTRKAKWHLKKNNHAVSRFVNDTVISKQWNTLDIIWMVTTTSKQSRSGSSFSTWRSIENHWKRSQIIFGPLEGVSKMSF